MSEIPAVRDAVPNAPATVPGLAGRAWRAVRPHLPALVFLAVMAWVYWHRIDAWLIDDDEEGYLYAAWRVSQGALPYRDFLTPQLPAFLFPGGLWLALFGPHTAVLRAWSAVLMLVAGGATYLTGRRLYGPAAGLAALAVVLLSDDLFPLARAWRPEASMLAMAALALYVFVRADETGRRRGYALASLLFALALLAKLFGALPWAGVAAYVIADGLTRGRPPRRAAGDLAALLVPGLALVALVMGGFQLLTPETYHAVLEHHLRQGAALAWWQVLGNALSFYGRALAWHAPLLAFVPLGVYAAWKLGGRRGLVVPWIVPTVLAFLFLSRPLFSRHLAYLLPALGLLLGAAVAWLVANLRVGGRARAAAALTVVAAVVAPFVFNDLETLGQAEVGTVRLGALVRALAPEGTRILADYPGIAFYGDRQTTYSGAGLSEGAVESGQITGAQLWDEMTAGDASLVLIDKDSQRGQLKDLVDFDDWLARVEGGYRRLGRFYRWHQPLDVYRRGDLPALGLDFGPLALETAAIDRSAVAAGDTVGVTAVLHADERPERAYTAFLHLIGPDGETWATGDTFMNNALFRGSEEWEPDEVVAVPMALTVPAGTPPGSYRLQMGLYDAATGDRLPFTAPDGTTGDARDIGTVEVTVPHRVPSAPTGTVLGTTGDFQLLSAEVPAEVRAGTPFRVWTTWRVVRPPDLERMLALRLEDKDGKILGPDSLDPRALWGWRASSWRAGEIVTVPVELMAYAGTPDGSARVVAGWSFWPAVADPITVGEVRVHGLGPLSTAVPPIARPLAAELGHGIAGVDGAIEVLGSSLPEAASAGSEVPFELYWRTRREIPRAYTALVHVLSEKSDLVAQADAPPERATTSWRNGEVIVDHRSLSLPADLPAGDYRVLVGLYDPADPNQGRLPVRLDGADRPDERVPLGLLRVTR